ncbi:E3 ubiquitin-protein ligase XIAP [Holothuria leucospilota]|uniref:E3 ubiquitin-protein ligase XIAP n=1 Tax=Holothuria leucospilota TaxID=206669 RepID=A0A9Q1BU44_HOLLE|nr:E3 ubiquitin-protein ligase XIAP [Holothuria leucospilota]
MSILSLCVRKALVDPKPATSSYPQYCNRRNRVLSFASWPPLYHQQPDAFAEAGFFSLGIDRVACFHCGKTLVNWVVEAQPWKEHARHSPSCRWLLEQKGKDFIDQVTKEYSSSEDILDIKTVLLDGSGNILDVFEKYPNYCSESARRATFKTWPIPHPQRPLDLAQAGFISRGIEDHVECFYCGVILGNWEPQYDPWQEHARHSPRCLWLLKQKGQCFIDDVTKKYDSLQNSHMPTKKDGHHKPSRESAYLIIFAKYTKYCFKGSRRESFSNWPVDHRQRIGTLAQAGFFSSGVGEQVKCFYCGETIVYWDPRKEPWEEHAQYSPTCKWLLHEKGQHFVDEVRKKYVSHYSN